MPEPAAAAVDELARTAVRLLGERGWWLATAESLTGGLVAAAITSVPGASRVFRGGVVAYATDLKASLLEVDADLLARVGAVDPAVAAQMADGARRRLRADVGLATTGVAGPDPQDGRPAGTVFVGVAVGALASGGYAVDASTAPQASGDRAAVRGRTVEAALTALVEALSP